MEEQYWEPLLKGQIEDLVADGIDADEIRDVIAPNADAYRSGRYSNGRPTDQEIDAMIDEAELNA